MPMGMDVKKTWGHSPQSYHLLQPPYRPCGIAPALVQERNEAAADDGAGGGGTSGIERLAVGHAEAYQAGMPQPQGVDVAEVRLPLFAEGALRPGDGGGGHHVDEAARQPVNLAHPFVLVSGVMSMTTCRP